MPETASQVWREFNVDGNSSTGRKSPEKSAIRLWGTGIESSLASTLATAQAALTLATSGVKADVAAVRLLVTSNTAASSMTNGASLDGETLATGDRVAKAYNGATGDATNGIYVVQSSGTAVRATDFDSSDEILRGRFTVADGTHAGEAWSVQNTAAISVGTTAIVIVMTTPADSYAAEVIAARNGAASLSARLLADADDNFFIGGAGNSGSSVEGSTAVGHLAANLADVDGTTALGAYALYDATGVRNTAVGYNAGASTAAGLRQTMIGYSAQGGAGLFDTIAIGYGAAADAHNQVAIGNSTIRRGSNGLGIR